MQVDEVAAEHLPLADPRVAPERLRAAGRVARKRARRIDVAPALPVAAGEPVHFGERQRARAPVGREVRRARRRPPRIRARAGEPLAELAQRPGVVVVPLALGEERIDVGVGVEVDADEEVGVRARERGEDRPRLLQVAALVAAHVRRVHVERQRARELRRVLRAGQALEEVVRHHLVLLVPLAVGRVLLEPVVDVPLRHVAVGVGPDAAVERHEHRQLLRDGVREHRVERVVADAALAALALRVPVGVERVVAGGALRHAKVEDRHAEAAAHGGREVRRVDRVELARTAQVDARERRQQVERLEARRREAGPARERRRLDQALRAEHRLAAVGGDRHDRKRPAVDARGRRVGREVAAELEACGRVAGDAGLHRGDVGTRDAGLRGIRAAVDADLDGAHAGRVQRPARDRDARPHHRLAGRRVDVAGGTALARRGGCGRRCRRRRRRALALVRDQRPDLDAGDGRHDGHDDGERARRAAPRAPARSARAVRGGCGRVRHGAHCSAGAACGAGMR